MKHPRVGERIPLELPVQVRWKAAQGKLQTTTGKTGNISANGLFMTIPTHLRSGTAISFSVRLPAEVTKVPVELVCRGRVVRQRKEGKLQGIAAIIDEYQLRPLSRH